MAGRGQIDRCVRELLVGGDELPRVDEAGGAPSIQVPRDDYRRQPLAEARHAVERRRRTASEQRDAAQDVAQLAQVAGQTGAAGAIVAREELAARGPVPSRDGLITG